MVWEYNNLSLMPYRFFFFLFSIERCVKVHCGWIRGSIMAFLPTFGMLSPILLRFHFL